VWVLDIDNPDALAALEDKHGPLPITRQSRSSRGLHLWFKAPVLPISNSTGRIAAGIDVRGEGGYVVAPPSVHPDGPTYTWVNDAPIVEAPSWLLALARKPQPKPTTQKTDAPWPSSGRSSAYGAAAFRKEIENLANAPEGGRNHQLNRSAFSLYQLVAAGELTANEVEAALIEACEKNGLVADDGLRQCLATIASGRSAGLKSPRSRAGSAA
jgi:hypothetical protein